MKARVILPTFILIFLIVGTAGAITFNQKTIGPVTFTTTGGLPLTAWSALSAFKGALNPISKALVLYQGVKAIAPSEVATLENNIANTLGYIIPGMELDHSYYPSNWTSPTSPPSSSTLQILYYNSGGVQITDPQKACEKILSNVGKTFSTLSPSGNNYYCFATDGNYYIVSPLGSTCPTGYTLSGSSCTLSDPSVVKWPSDGKPTIMKDAQKLWQPYGRDPDTLTDSGIGTDTITRTGKDQYGNPTEETIKSNPDGTTTYTRKSETIDQSTGQTITNNTTIYMDTNGTVTNITENNTYGPLPPPGTTTTPVELPPITVSGDGGTLNKTLPQTETAEAALTRLKAHIATNSIIAPLLNPSAASGTCPMFLQVNMGTFGNHSTNVMCDLYELMIPTLDVVTKFAWSLAAILIFFSA